MSLRKVFKLNTGAFIPAFGCAVPAVVKNTKYNSGAVRARVRLLLTIGYRHLDTGAIHKNDIPLGEGIEMSRLHRSNLFLTSKLWNHDHAPHRVREFAIESLNRINSSYFDLFLMHWPVAFKQHEMVASVKQGSTITITNETESSSVKKNSYSIDDIEDIDYVDTYLAMEKLMECGQAKAIGVANFDINKLDRLIKKTKITPAVIQVELHPYLPQNELLDFCKKRNIHVSSNAPYGLRDSEVRRDPTILDIAEKMGKDPRQVLLAWGMQRGTSVIAPGMTNMDLREFYEEIFLETKYFEAINALSKTKKQRYIQKPDWGIIFND